MGKTDDSAKKRSDWIGMIGDWRWYCDILADFDPVKSDVIYSQCRPDQIARAFISKIAYNYQKPPSK